MKSIRNFFIDRRRRNVEKKVLDEQPDEIEWCYLCHRWETKEQYHSKSKKDAVKPPIHIRVGRLVSKPIKKMSSRLDKLQSWLAQDWDQSGYPPPEGYKQHCSWATKVKPDA